MKPRCETKPARSVPRDTGRILVVDDHAQARESISDVLGHAGHVVDCAASAVEASHTLKNQNYDVVITDLRMPGMSGLEFICRLEANRCDAQIVMITAHASVATAVEAMRHGAFDYIEKPFDADELEQLVGSAMQMRKAQGRLPDATGTAPQVDGSAMIGSSAQMQTLRERLLQAAPTDETVLISGESGTGKELVARSIHAASSRSAAPLVSLNCPVLSAQLMESELFGHQRGAFTGADAPRVGRFELADGGTILLDEITEIELPLQAKLLRVLQEKTFERVGSSETRHVNVRVLATTNRNLREEVMAARFREDLYYRLAVVPIQVPPLRERREDIAELTDYFLERAAIRLGKAPCTLESTACDLLTDYHWPGNVRELENIVTRASVLNQGGAVTADELRGWLIDAPGQCGSSQSGPSQSGTATDAGVPVGLSLQEMERKMIEATLRQFDGHRGKTAKALGIGLRTLSGKLKAYGYAPREKVAAKAG